MREGHRHAAGKVIAEMERWCGRQAHDGMQHTERTGNFCAAVYEHDTNRSLEALLHTHVVIFNLTRAANGKHYGQEFRELMDRSKYLTQVYNNALAAWEVDHGADLTFDQYGGRSCSSSRKKSGKPPLTS
jgi:conjugative relaxase-like TrwC/TraI family protein